MVMVEDLSCRRRTEQRGRHDVPAAPADAGAYHAGTGPGPHGVRPEPDQHLPIRTSEGASTRGPSLQDGGVEQCSTVL